MCWRRATGSPLPRATSSPRPTYSCGGSSTGCRWSPTSRPIRCPKNREAVERFACFLGYESRAAFASDLLGHLNIVQGHYAKLFEGDPTGTAKLPAADYGAGPDDPRLLEHLASARLQEADHGGGDRAAMDDRRLSRVPDGGDAQRLCRIRSGADRRPCRRRRPRQRGDGVRPFPAGVAARRPADFAAQPEPRPGRTGRADSRRSAAARRHAGAPAADHGRLDRSALLRRDAGPARIVGAARRDAWRMRIPTRNSSTGCDCSARKACS